MTEAIQQHTGRTGRRALPTAAQARSWRVLSAQELAVEIEERVGDHIRHAATGAGFVVLPENLELRSGERTRDIALRSRLNAEAVFAAWSIVCEHLREKGYDVQVSDSAFERQIRIIW